MENEIIARENRYIEGGGGGEELRSVTFALCEFTCDGDHG